MLTASLINANKDKSLRSYEISKLEGCFAYPNLLHGTTDWFQTGKGVCQSFILSSCLFNLYAQYIMRNTGLDEEQAGIKVRRNINNLRYADDTTLKAESEEELKSLLIKRRVKKLA